ncbi:ATP-binding protein [Colwellia hornerae]|uniref:histidine kinase n=1 Tax=Colwellia hornerae TaxID=89402 RepID=A0A5C6QHJ5_9GAMM|nr:ATP-binding protein [Colwellia hornerae]TWX52817.1 two-component sensor histidine kinase [Colwellia hornerae]TWX59171.1 two-component sensor histidine kinase [Colwellia hornerae]TWX68198.1 two-component sensor histidine kinase [Colwellia hornerae]
MSIRRYLVLILLSIITLMTFFAAIQGYKASMEQATSLFDEQLVLVGKTLLATSATYPDQATENRLSAVTVVPSNHIAYQVFRNNTLLLRTDNAPEQLITELPAGFIDLNFIGQRWRVYIETLPDEPTQINQLKVLIAQPLEQRFSLAEQVILSAVTPIILIIPVIALFIFMAIRQGLKPLTVLRRELSEKKINDLSQLTSETSTKELQPVIQTLNLLFERLSAAFSRERYFASDAAHELRTPLSVLKINVHNLQMTQSEKLDATGQASLMQLGQSVDRMAHVVDQILTLNRTNPDQLTMTVTKLELQVLLQQVISDLYPEIMKHQHDISLESQATTIYANEFALLTLVKNLIGNACKYTPNGGQILVRTVVDDHSFTLTVEDSGPGIDSSEYQRVFDRFYRVGGDGHQSTVVGCGLGLAIVQHIVKLHHATITLAKSMQLNGLSVSVTFPQKTQAVDLYLNQCEKEREDNR